MVSKQLICSICKKKKITTNKKVPFVCEKCLRKDGYDLILQSRITKILIGFLFWLVILLAILLGTILFVS